jgi:hypothetical protein
MAATFLILSLLCYGSLATIAYKAVAYFSVDDDKARGDSNA